MMIASWHGCGSLVNFDDGMGKHRAGCLRRYKHSPVLGGIVMPSGGGIADSSSTAHLFHRLLSSIVVYGRSSVEISVGFSEMSRRISLGVFGESYQEILVGFAFCRLVRPRVSATFLPGIFCRAVSACSSERFRWVPPVGFGRFCRQVSSVLPLDLAAVLLGGLDGPPGSLGPHASAAAPLASSL